MDRTDEHLLVRPRDEEAADAEPDLVPVADVRAFAVRVPRSRGRGMLRGMAIGGLVVGSAAGLGFGIYRRYNPCSGWFCFSAAEEGLFAGIVFGTLGATVGGLRGVASPGTRWVDANLPNRAELTLEPAIEGLALGVSVRF